MPILHGPNILYFFYTMFFLFSLLLSLFLPCLCSAILCCLYSLVPLFKGSSIPCPIFSVVFIFSCPISLIPWFPVSRNAWPLSLLTSFVTFSAFPYSYHYLHLPRIPSILFSFYSLPFYFLPAPSFFSDFVPSYSVSSLHSFSLRFPFLFYSFSSRRYDPCKLGLFPFNLHYLKPILTEARSIAISLIVAAPFLRLKSFVNQVKSNPNPEMVGKQHI